MRAAVVARCFQYRNFPVALVRNVRNKSLANQDVSTPVSIMTAVGNNPDQLLAPASLMIPDPEFIARRSEQLDFSLNQIQPDRVELEIGDLVTHPK